ncbi:cyclic nucleotide-binding domain-containing protein [Myxococcus sp. CA051A]|uniref:cyclic nucleotide-binding domain-containing protein n=1 Tax=unclassified Myxococcus TaxID=2648731 RepID=UPI00157B071B|nr:MULTISPECIES: cyclic nucleotide-binding domain-containing protein [unclassified Myxococcus]NTX07209.1 cyclic nucleotide-binding domain-containing protein [Myxococcus sp. CA040A]NTX17543.1 cyclic nucleotide-binding domain-containing protein [Myxococcus sp. CA056]NTX39123.1 cyclic nucleotide-binding domain-containing protein [Myxococcus sp. CA033]NTX66463.1 cyclic nucleotide-binding domain-containing protein [Myxococcus sp. CA051A]
MEKLAVIAASPLFEMLSPVELDRLAELARTRHCVPGEVIFHEGDLGDSLFLVVEGQVEVARNGTDGLPRTLAVLSPPEFFGEMGLIDKDYRSATVRARTQAHLLQLTAGDLRAFRNEYADGFTFVVVNIARSLAARLREANARLSSNH